MKKAGLWSCVEVAQVFDYDLKRTLRQQEREDRTLNRLCIGAIAALVFAFMVAGVLLFEGVFHYW